MNNKITKPCMQRTVRKTLHAVAALHAACLCVTLHSVGAWQQTEQGDAQTPAPAELERVLQAARAHIQEHVALFKELTAEETRTVEVYERTGKLARRRRTVADFVVYQSQLDARALSEYRNVREVDGRAVKGRDERVVKLYERAARAGSISKELERINRESNRYNLGWEFNGFTLAKALPLRRNARAFFTLETAGREQLDGHELLSLKFQQTAESPYLRNFKSDWLAGLKLTDLRIRWRLWLDAEAGQLRREELELTMRSAVVPDPVVVGRFEFDYAPSRFGLWLPQRMTFNVFSPTHLKRGKPVTTYLRARTVAVYDSFQRFGVNVQGGDVVPQRP